MSTGKLDQSLDDIVKTNRPTRRTVRNRRVTKTTTTVTPAGGVTKKTKPAKGRKSAAAAAAEAVAKNKPAIPVFARGESKIVVSGLPLDISEQQVKVYFAETIGPVKRVMIAYGPNGQSRGIATVVFPKPDTAAFAAEALKGIMIEKKPLKIEVVVDAKSAPVAVPAKGLADRVTQPKNQPKKAGGKAVAKVAAKSATKPVAGKPKAKGRAGRAKPKTAEELDAEMTDYFGDGTTTTGQENAAVNGNVNGGDAGMEEVM